MKTLFTVLISFLILTSAATAAQPRPANPAPIQQGTGHPFACGDYSGGRVLLVSADGKVDWEYPAPHCNDLWVLPSGNTVMTNWLGHGRLGTAPHIIEVTPEKEVVWTFSDHRTMKTIATIQLLDVPGDVTQGEILH